MTVLVTKQYLTVSNTTETEATKVDFSPNTQTIYKCQNYIKEHTKEKTYTI